MSDAKELARTLAALQEGSWIKVPFGQEWQETTLRLVDTLRGNLPALIDALLVKAAVEEEFGPDDYFRVLLMKRAAELRREIAGDDGFDEDKWKRENL